MAIDLDQLTRLWDRRWPNCPPVPHQFPEIMRDQWVRFHSLPRSKRYADTLSEYQILLDRHNTVLSELKARDIYLFTATCGRGAV